MCGVNSKRVLNYMARILLHRFEYLGKIKLSCICIYIQIEPDNYSDIIRVFTWTIVHLFRWISQTVEMELELEFELVHR